MKDITAKTRPGSREYDPQLTHTVRQAIDQVVADFLIDEPFHKEIRAEDVFDFAIELQPEGFKRLFVYCIFKIKYIVHSPGLKTEDVNELLKNKILPEHYILQPVLMIKKIMELTFEEFMEKVRDIEKNNENAKTYNIYEN